MDPLTQAVANRLGELSRSSVGYHAPTESFGVWFHSPAPESQVILVRTGYPSVSRAAQAVWEIMAEEAVEVMHDSASQNPG